jgi:hypothetical protein
MERLKCLPLGRLVRSRFHQQRLGGRRIHFTERGHPRDARQDRLRLSMSSLCRSELLSGKDLQDVEGRSFTGQ